MYVSLILGSHVFDLSWIYFLVWLLICAPLPQNEGYTPLYVAAQEGHDAALSALVAHPDVDVNKANVCSPMILPIAVCNGCSK